MFGFPREPASSSLRSAQERKHTLFPILYSWALKPRVYRKPTLTATPRARISSSSKCSGDPPADLSSHVRTAAKGDSMARMHMGQIPQSFHLIGYSISARSPCLSNSLDTDKCTIIALSEGRVNATNVQPSSDLLSALRPTGRLSRRGETFFFF